MPDQPSDATPESGRVAASDPLDSPASADADPRIQVLRTDWRLGGPTVAKWREWLLALAFISLGAAIIAAAVVTSIWTSLWAVASVTLIILIGMLVPVAWAFTRSRPAGLLRFRALDLLYGVVLGCMLRLVQGWVELAAGGEGRFPSYPLIEGRLPAGWWITEGVGAVVVAPVVEEFVFRAVVLVALYTMLRPRTGRFAAGISALLLSSGAFMLAHGLILTPTIDAVVAVALLGIVCGLLVVLTGRIWGAVLVHVIFNATYVVLALIGTFLG